MKELKDILKNSFEDSFQIGRINKQEAILTSKSNEANSIIIGWTSLGLSLTFDSVIGLKYYAEVESIMTSVINKSQIQVNYFGKQQSTINVFKRLERTEINYKDSDEIKKEICKIKKVVKDEIEPIWDKLDSVQKLANHVNRLNDAELSEFLSNPTLIRKLAINRLADKAYRIEDEIKRIKKEYSDAENQYPKVFNNYSNAINVLEKQLNSS